jgi:hypothetical protein
MLSSEGPKSRQDLCLLQLEYGYLNMVTINSPYCKGGLLTNIYALQEYAIYYAILLHFSASGRAPPNTCYGIAAACIAAAMNSTENNIFQASDGCNHSICQRQRQ